MATFTENFNYREDLVCGITGQCDVYVDRFINDKSTGDGEGDPRSTGERAEHWARVTQKSKMFIHAFNDPITHTDFSEQVLQVPVSSDLDVNAYQQALQSHPKFAPQNTKMASMRSLAKGDELASGLSKADLDPKKLADLEGLLAVRRACKFGIEDAVSRKGCKVHYILDGIVIADVVSKKTFPLSSGGTGVPITTSELRFLFREWSRFRHTGRVIFYRDFNETGTPWSSEALQGWAAYAMHLLEKRHADDANLNAAKACWSGHDWKGVIGVFHNIALR